MSRNDVTIQLITVSPHILSTVEDFESKSRQKVTGRQKPRHRSHSKTSSVLEKFWDVAELEKQNMNMSFLGFAKVLCGSFHWGPSSERSDRYLWRCGVFMTSKTRTKTCNDVTCYPCTNIPSFCPLHTSNLNLTAQANVTGYSLEAPTLPTWGTCFPSNPGQFSAKILRFVICSWHAWVGYNLVSSL